MGLKVRLKITIYNFLSGVQNICTREEESSMSADLLQGPTPPFLLMSVMIKIFIKTFLHPDGDSRSPPKFNHLFLLPLLRFSENLTQIC